MRIGVYFGRSIFLEGSAGGASSFQASIFNALLQLKSKHELYIFSDNPIDVKNTAVKFVQIQRHYALDRENILKEYFLKIPRKLKRIKLIKKYITPLNKVVLDNQIDLMWFVTPAFEFVEVPFIYTVWDLEHRLQSYFPEVSVAGWKFEEREKRYNFAISRAAYVIIGNQAGKKQIMQFYGLPEERVKILPLPTPDFVLDELAVRLDPSTLRQSSGLGRTANFKNYLFYPAQFWPHKNHIVILHALKILKENHNIDFSVVFTGSDKGNLKYIKEKVEELGLKDKVFFLGFVSTEDLISLYQNAFALVFASFFGPDNIPPLEAFALKCPVISAKFEGAEYQLGNSAILFDPKSEHDLVAAIKKLHDSSKLRDILIDSGFKKAQNWTPRDYVNGVIKFIDEFEPIRRCWSSKDKYIHL